MILNDDDELESDAIEKLADCFWNPKHGVDLSKVVLSWCPCKIQDENRKVTHVSGGGPSPVEAAIDLVVGHNNGTGAVRGFAASCCALNLPLRLAIRVSMAGFQTLETGCGLQLAVNSLVALPNRLPDTPLTIRAAPEHHHRRPGGARAKSSFAT